MKTLLIALAALLATPAMGKDAPIYVVRHFDTPAGARDPDLLPQGAVRAEILANWFKGKKLKAIFVSDFKRSRQTAAPLAKTRRITAEIYDPGNTPAIVARARAARAPVLIVGHSNTVPDLVEQLGASRPAELKHEDFGDVWIIRGGRSARVRLSP